MEVLISFILTFGCSGVVAYIVYALMKNENDYNLHQAKIDYEIEMRRTEKYYSKIIEDINRKHADELMKIWESEGK